MYSNFFHFYKEIWRNFWEKHPALWGGIGFMSGIGAFYGHVSSLLPVIFIGFGLKSTQRFFLIITALFGYFYTGGEVQFPKEQINCYGWIRIKIERTYDQEENFGESRIYEGKAVSYFRLCERNRGNFSSKDTPDIRLFTPLGLPIKIKSTAGSPIYPADRDYLVYGLINIDPSGKVRFVSDRELGWVEVGGSPYRLAEVRYWAKKVVRGVIEREVPDARSGELLAALATGDLADRKLVSDFRKLGLIHLLAISGFHFSLLAGMLHFGLRYWVGPRRLAMWLTLLLSSYFVFLGPSPSIARAWISAMIYLVGTMMNRGAVPMNSLGVALLVVLLIDPTSVTTIGFQLSFAATGAILLVYGPLENCFRRQMKIRMIGDLVPIRWWEKHVYVLIGYLRGALALNVGVTVITLPVLLMRIGAFPVAAVVYNLFFPFLLSFSLTMLLISFLVPPVHIVNSYYTSKLLELTEVPSYAAPVWELGEKGMGVLGVVVVPVVVVVFSVAILFQGYWERREGGGGVMTFV